jgi:hypothetical protein
MYLLYEKEVDKAMRTEQERLLYWIAQAAKLNPNASLSTILNAADDYVKSTVYKIYEERSSLFNKQEIIREAEEKSALLEFTRQELEAENARKSEEAALAEIEAQRAAEDAESSSAAQEKAEREEATRLAAEESDRFAVEEAEQEEKEETLPTPIDGYEEPELEVEEKEYADIDLNLPSREDEEAAAEKLSRQKIIRANRDAIFGNRSEIDEL